MDDNPLIIGGEYQSGISEYRKDLHPETTVK